MHSTNNLQDKIEDQKSWGRHGRVRVVVGFITTYAINAYYHKSCQFEPHTWQGVLDTTICDKRLSVTCGRSIVFTGYSGFLQQ